MVLHSIAVARATLADAKMTFNNILREAQAACDHPRVYESPAYKICTDGQFFMARRVCECCGLHEFGGWGSQATDYGSGKWQKFETANWNGRRGKSEMDHDFVCQTTKEELVKMIIGEVHV